jgi:hypothetical protein
VKQKDPSSIAGGLLKRIEQLGPSPVQVSVDYRFAFVRRRLLCFAPSDTRRRDFAADFFFVFGWIRSGNTFRPVVRFHSSYWSSVIFPSTRSCANLRRCALLLNGTSA